MARISLYLAAIVAVSLVEIAMAFLYVAPDEWEGYKSRFGKFYPTKFEEEYAKYYYAYNKKMIEKHNDLFTRGLRTYTLDINQFTDLRFIHFNAMFPLAKSYEKSHHVKPEFNIETIAETFLPSEQFEIKFNVEDQGTKCNSGWAYATAKSLEMFTATKPENGPNIDVNPPSLSAQNLIDCAGRSRACKNEVPQAGFDYLTLYDQKLHLEKAYPNQKEQSQLGMCLPRSEAEPQIVVGLKQYARIPDGDDDTLAKALMSFYPVVVEFNPTSFEFMHYKSGVFQQPISRKGSHFMVVVGYGKEVIRPNLEMDYWLLQNSFGTTWGEEGLIKVYKSKHSKITKNAILPYDN